MAIFRKVSLSFWEDVKVADEFTPEDKYFMLYLLTNPHTNQAGCYQITKRQMEFETGYNRDTIEKLIKRFTEVLKVIQYSDETKEVFLLNWHKYNWSNSPKVLACILKEVETVKTKDFRYCIDTLLKEYGYNIDNLEIQKHNKNKNKNKNKEEEQEKEKLSNSFNPDLAFDKNVNQVFELYEKLCPNLIKLKFEKRNKDRLQQAKNLLELCQYDFKYIKELFTKANEQICFYDEKICFQSLMKNHEKIYQGLGKKINTQQQNKKDEVKEAKVYDYDFPYYT